MNVAEQKARCPVHDGEIWRVGRHWFACGDLEDSITLGQLLSLAPDPTLLYSDPPWYSAQGRYYRTLSERDGAKGNEVNWARLFTAVLAPARDRKLLAYIEMARVSRLQAMGVARDMGATTGPWWPVHYAKQTESTMFTADFRTGLGPIAHIDGPDARSAPEQALAGHEVGVVLDPCTGNGWTARAADRAGWTFVGHELTPRRLWMAMRRIHDEPVRVA